MLKSLLLAIVAMVATISPLAGLASPPDETTIDDCVDRRAAVEFPHKLHFDSMECSNCHHTQEDLSLETSDQAKACGSCHTEPEKPDTPACSQLSMKKNPFHIRCVACHKERAEGPTKCNECHPRE